MNNDLTKASVHAILLERYKKWVASFYCNEEFSVTVWQETPSDPRMLLPPDHPDATTSDAKRTVAKVATRYNGKLYKDIGFATLNMKLGDIWYSTYGINMAISKAIANIARQIALGRPAALVMSLRPCYEEATFSKPPVRLLDLLPNGKGD